MYQLIQTLYHQNKTCRDFAEQFLDSDLSLDFFLGLLNNSLSNEIKFSKYKKKQNKNTIA
ncbi:hypothetical protein BpHYR1_004916 [Brachionus plicatilis]|uniref:Uncharacterized protein n=1 Tax=Brachionus plicatilis TaxID=10195 RepID=A0A3M7QZ68_BRAPC|nr:hypothetical protein BpHYR1_004916 [Brachionus plicatilis]